MCYKSLRFKIQVIDSSARLEKMVPLSDSAVVVGTQRLQKTLAYY